MIARRHAILALLQITSWFSAPWTSNYRHLRVQLMTGQGGDDGGLAEIVVIGPKGEERTITADQIWEALS